MSTSLFSYRTRGGSIPDNKPRIYFTCHPDDFEKYFETLCNDILNVLDCAVFYTDDMTKDLTDGNAQIYLERMNLFVIPVTLDLLTKPNRAMEFDFRFAKQKHIPVLPLLIDKDIYKIYKKPENFGEMQYLKPFSTDETAIDYKDKLKKHLTTVIVSNELVKQIRESFDAYIFLSYRKKDRRFANELMRLIHKDPRFEDIAIWFDEFLTPGEGFRDNIKRYLYDSVLFALLVTPNLLEHHPDGAPNFIMAEEYPSAKNLNKPILPVEMEETDFDLLKLYYSDIPDCSDIKDEAGLYTRLTDFLFKYAINGNNDDPLHNYLIGLAYLNGIDVEIDKEKGLRLITKAAEAGLPDAMRKLFVSYSSGDNVQLDYDKALLWSKRLYEFHVKGSGEDHPDTLLALNELACTYLRNGDFNTALNLLEKCYSLTCRVQGEESPEALTALGNLADAYGKIGNINKQLELNNKCYDLKCKLFGEEDPRTLITLSNLAMAFLSAGDYRKAIIFNEECLRLNTKIYGSEHSHTLLSLNNLALAYRLSGNIQDSIELFGKCYELEVKVNGREHPDTILVLDNLAQAYSDAGDYEKALESGNECYALSKKVLGEKHPNTLNIMNNLADSYIMNKEPDKAHRLLEDCYVLSCEVLGKDHPDTIATLMNLANIIGKEGDLNEQIRLLEKCRLLLTESLGEKHPNTISCLSNLALAYGRSGDNKKSIELNTVCYETRKDILGKEHPETLLSLHNLALQYNDTKEFGKEIELLEECYPLLCKILGESHPFAHMTLKQLADAYYYAGNVDKCLELIDIYNLLTGEDL